MGANLHSVFVLVYHKYNSNLAIKIHCFGRTKALKYLPVTHYKKWKTYRYFYCPLLVNFATKNSKICQKKLTPLSPSSRQMRRSQRLNTAGSSCSALAKNWWPKSKELKAVLCDIQSFLPLPEAAIARPSRPAPHMRGFLFWAVIIFSHHNPV